MHQVFVIIISLSLKCNCVTYECLYWLLYCYCGLLPCSGLVVSKHGLYAGGLGLSPTSATTTRTAVGRDVEHVSLNLIPAEHRVGQYLC